MKYTLAVTSCNRLNLLKQTLDSFIAHADALPEATVIVEDSSIPQPAWLSEPRYKALGKRGVWLPNGKRRGQMFTIDRLYDAVETPYVFHLEDDWLFTKGHFIQPSFDILEKYPLISSVSLRGIDCNGHPLVGENYPFAVQQPWWQGGWGGYSFNPGLRRMSDLAAFGGSFGNYVGYSTHGCGDEQVISRNMLALGFRMAVLDNKPHIKHLGEGVSRAIEPLPPLPRVLLAVPVARKYEYGTHTSGIKRVTDGRIEAVRATWWKDVAKFPNVDARFFYGCKDGFANGVYTDEMSLAVPDDYAHLPHKIKAICQYALRNGYDFLVKSDDDTVLYLDRLMRSGFDLTDQMGWYGCQHKGAARCNCYATGMCYTLSKRAMQLVADAPLLDRTHCLHWAEDYWVGGIMRQAGIKPIGHSGWVPSAIGHYVKFPLPRNTVAAHSVRPEDMRAWYAGGK